MATLQLVAADRQNRTILLRVLKFTPQQESELSDTLLKGDSSLHTCGAFWFVDLGEYITFDEFIWQVRELESKYGKITVPLLSLNSSPDQCKELNEAFEDMENSPEKCEVGVADEEIPEPDPSPSDKAHKVFDLLLKKLNLTSETRPRGTFIESYGICAYIRYNGEIVRQYDYNTDMTDEFAEAEAESIIAKYGTPKPDGSEDIMDPKDIPPCLL